MPVVAASEFGKLTIATVNKRTDRKKDAIKADRSNRPFLHFLEKNSKEIGWAGSKLTHTLKFNAGLTMQTWSGDVTLQDPKPIRNLIEVETPYSNCFMNYDIKHDEYRKLGFSIPPNSTEQSISRRAQKMSGSEYEMLVDSIKSDVDSFDDNWDLNFDLKLHTQQADATDIPGLNSIVPLRMTGMFAGHDRASQPLLQHLLFAGNDGASDVRHLSGSATVNPDGTSGTLLKKIERAINVLRSRVANSGMPKGRWIAFAGAGAIEKIKDEYRYRGITTNRDAASPGKVDMSIMDDDVMVGRLPVIWDPTLDHMDTVSADERGLGLSGGAVAITGGSGAGATAAVYTAEDGTISDVVVTARGLGYQTAPSVAVTGLGAGTGATFQAYIYASSAGTGKVEVDADDSRLGQLAYIEVTAAGSGYTAAAPLNFTDCMYILFEPCWELRPQQGLNKYMSIPNDQPRKRATEVQCDGTYFLRSTFNPANGVLHIAGS